jgi:methionyl aminopeptidase
MKKSLIKSKEEIDILREGGARLAHILSRLAEMVRPGIAASELEREARRLVAEGGDMPSFLGYKGAEDSREFPAALCVSVNDEVVHGLPSKEKILREGDITVLDLGIWHKGLCTDAAIAVPVGKISLELQKLVETTKKSLAIGIAAVREGAFVGDIGDAIEKFVRTQGRFGIVRDLAGHGVGHDVHEEPIIPHYGKSERGIRLEAGMVLAIEPMLTLGAEKTRLGPDGFAYCTEDGSVSAQFEHTIVVTNGGAEILTK